MCAFEHFSHCFFRAPHPNPHSLPDPCWLFLEVSRKIFISKHSKPLDPSAPSELPQHPGKGIYFPEFLSAAGFWKRESAQKSPWGEVTPIYFHSSRILQAHTAPQKGKKHLENVATVRHSSQIHSSRISQAHKAPPSGVGRRPLARAKRAP